MNGDCGEMKLVLYADLCKCRLPRQHVRFRRRSRSGQGGGCSGNDSRGQERTSIVTHHLLTHGMCFLFRKLTCFVPFRSSSSGAASPSSSVIVPRTRSPRPVRPSGKVCVIPSLMRTVCRSPSGWLCLVCPRFLRSSNGQISCQNALESPQI